MGVINRAPATALRYIIDSYAPPHHFLELRREAHVAAQQGACEVVGEGSALVTADILTNQCLAFIAQQDNLTVKI